MAIPVLKIEIDELKNSIKHLERSNRELKELLQRDPDPEYRLAIGENITTIAKKRARVAALEEELRCLTGEEYESDAVAVPVSEEIARGEDTAPRSAGDVGDVGLHDMQMEELQRRTQAEEHSTYSMELTPATAAESAARSSGAAADAHMGQLYRVVAEAQPTAGCTGTPAPSGSGVTGVDDGSGTSGVWL